MQGCVGMALCVNGTGVIDVFDEFSATTMPISQRRFETMILFIKSKWISAITTSPLEHADISEWQHFLD